MKFLRNYKLDKFNICTKILLRNYAACAGASVSGLVLGVYDSRDSDGSQQLTEAGERLNESTNGYLKEILKKTHIPLGKVEVFTGLGIQGFTHIAFAGLGSKSPNRLNLTEQLNEEKENIRIAIGAGARRVQDVGANKIMVDGVTVPEAAAEGAMLGTFIYTANKTTGEKQGPQIELFDHPDTNSWASGEINAESQNWARYLSHAPPNLKKPELYVQEIMEKLCKFDIRVDIRSREWMLLRKMNAVVAMIKKNCSPPILLEASYCGDDPNEKPITLVGKGNVFDSGGLFLKPYKGMTDFRADLSGSAAILASLLAVARKRLPINLRCTILIYENMPSPLGVKPGDVFVDKTGLSIRLSNPDNDCRVILADVLNFTDYYSPSLIVNVGSFTRSITCAMGTAASGAFTTTHELWSEVQRAGLESGDRFWRMPLWKYFDKLNKSHRTVDIDNASNKKGGDCCQAAMFLRHFVPMDQNCCCPQRLPYIHIDCFGTGLLDQTEEEIEPYYRKGIKMGRPTRGLIQFLYHRACLLPKKKSDKIKQK